MEGVVLCEWSRSLLEAGRIEDARARALAAQAAFQASDQDPTAWFLLGKLFLSLGGRNEARGLLSRYLVEAPGGRFAQPARELLERAR